MVPTKEGMKNSPMLVTRKRETVWIRRSLTTPVKSRAMSSSMLMTLAGKGMGSSAAMPSPTRQTASTMPICAMIPIVRTPLAFLQKERF